MTELETLNMLLRLIGSSAVNSLATTHPDAANAKATMLRISRKAQRRGWWFNIDYNMRYEPNDQNEIILSKEISSVVCDNKAYVLRGTKVHNIVDRTTKFNTPITATRQIRVVEWDEMPEVMQEYCAYYAASEFIRDELEDPQKQLDLAKSAAGSLMELKKQELEETEYNIFDKRRVAQALNGIRPYGRVTTRFFGDPDK